MRSQNLVGAFVLSSVFLSLTPPAFAASTDAKNDAPRAASTADTPAAPTAPAAAAGASTNPNPPAPAERPDQKIKTKSNIKND